MLIVGEDPGPIASYVESYDPENRPAGYDAAKTAIVAQLRRGHVEGCWVNQSRTDIDGTFLEFIENSIDLVESRVNVFSLAAWLDFMEFDCEFFGTGRFGSDQPRGPGYLNPKHPRYAPKLSAAIKSWLAMEGTDLAGRTPKQALTNWLREHASEFGLCDADGKPNETGIEETAKVANWQPGGGAPKTP